MKERYCLNCGKLLTKRTQKYYCCCSCSAKSNNAKRVQTTKGKTAKRICIKCGVEFDASIHINKNKCLCENCKKHNRQHSKNKLQILTLSDISKRTMTKILKRMNAKCSICGWNEASCDLHHIVPRKDGGEDNFDNLIVVCPNCHRICHTTNRYNFEFLKQRNIEIMYKNWRDFYHISN